MRVNPINTAPYLKVSKIKSTDNNLNNKNFKETFKKENKKMNGSGKRR